MRIDLTGQRFGRLLVIRHAGVGDHGVTFWACRCDCGKDKVVASGNLRRGNTRSCGCLSSEAASAKNLRHGMYGTKVYKAWCSILYRCTNPKSKSYPNYGGRGIGVAFKDFESFYAEVGDPPPHSTLDRIDNSRGYEPGNLRWATMKKQLRNTRRNRLLTHHGKSQTVTEWAEEIGLPKSTIESRLLKGASAEEALNPLIREPGLLTFKGRSMTVAQWGKETGLGVRIILVRLSLGWTVARALTQPVRTKLTLVYKREKRTISEWCQKLNIPRKVLDQRLMRGWSVERALTQPLRRKEE